MRCGMKKNGFISISVVYSFFFIFLMMLLFIVNNLINDRVLLSKIKEQVKTEIAETNFAQYLINNYDEDGLNLVYHDGTILNDSKSFAVDAKDYSYRYSGANPNNYVCLKDTCNNNDLFRVIGVIDGKVKLIKHTPLLSIHWHTTDKNDYASSWIKGYLNETYLSYLEDNNISKLIETTTWHTAGFSSNMINKNVYEIYDMELGINMNNAIYDESKIALPYVSDYAYATQSNNFAGTISNANNWMFEGNLWTISRSTDGANQVFYIENDGTLKSATSSQTKNVKPVFFLKTKVIRKGGTGTITDPYKVGD